MVIVEALKPPEQNRFCAVVACTALDDLLRPLGPTRRFVCGLLEDERWGLKYFFVFTFEVVGAAMLELELSVGLFEVHGFLV